MSDTQEVPSIAAVPPIAGGEASKVASPSSPPSASGGITASHAMVGVTAAGAMQALTTFLTGYQGFGFPQGLDVAHAGSAAFLIVAAGLAIYKGAAWLISWKWPSAPPLPIGG